MQKYKISHTKQKHLTLDFDTLVQAQSYKEANNLSEAIESYQVQIDELDQSDSAATFTRYRITYIKESFLSVEFASEAEALAYKSKNNLNENIESFEETLPIVTPDFTQIVKDAIDFGNELLVTFAAENVALGITQAGKTKEVADYLADVTRYIQTGSLYEVMNEIDRLIAEGLPLKLDPFISPNRINQFKNKIIEYLS